MLGQGKFVFRDGIYTIWTTEALYTKECGTADRLGSCLRCSARRFSRVYALLARGVPPRPKAWQYYDRRESLPQNRKSSLKLDTIISLYINTLN